jgi:hypothetical protein
MKTQIQEKKVLVRGKEVIIGVDVLKESWHVTAQTDFCKGEMDQAVSSMGKRVTL